LASMGSGEMEELGRVGEEERGESRPYAIR
jgi:hypothetical protein